MTYYRPGLGAWGDRPAGTWSSGYVDPDLVMQHCVLVRPGELPGSATQDPNCPAGFELMETTAEDFQPGGVLAPGGGGVVADLSEWEVGPDGWLVHHPREEIYDPDRDSDADPTGDAPTVNLGLEYDVDLFGYSVPVWVPVAAVAAAGLLLLKRRSS